MTLAVPGHGSVPVVWMGDDMDLSGEGADGEIGRRGQSIRGIVHHRIVGGLESAIVTALRNRTRQVGYHFAIGHLDGELTVVQFVALQNTAYTQGQNDDDRAACRWRPWIDAGRPLVNNMCVSIEHEDGGSANRYVVEEPIKATSIVLDRAMLSGDPREFGIRCDDASARQLARLPINTDSIIDHHVIAPVTKPYCWRKVGEDLGFPQDRYIAALTTPPQQEDESVEVIEGLISPQIATVIAPGTFHLEPGGPSFKDAVVGDSYQFIRYAGGGWLGVLMTTRYGSADGVPRPRIVYIPRAAIRLDNREAPDEVAELRQQLETMTSELGAANTRIADWSGRFRAIKEANPL